MLDPGSVIEKFGITVASLIGLVWVLRWLSGIHLRALNDRIEILEAVNAQREAELTQMRKDALDRTDAHAEIIRDMSVRFAKLVAENTITNKAYYEAVARLVDSLDHCPHRDYAPHTDQHHPRVRSSAELPAPPATDRISP